MKKNIILIFTLIICIILVFLLIYFWKSKSKVQIQDFSPDSNSLQTESLKPIFMTTEEKNKFFIPPEKTVQVLKRDDNGEIMIYKIIENQDQVITKPLLPDNK